MVIELSGVQFVQVIIRFRVQFGINLHDLLLLIIYMKKFA